MMRTFSLTRWWGIVAKEVNELKRDQLSIGLIVLIPLMQIFMFGYAINSDARHLPSALIDHDNSSHSRNAIAALMNTGYFSFTHTTLSEAEAAENLQNGKVKFVFTIPADFGRNIIRGQPTSILIEADATDPSSIINALAATESLPERILGLAQPGWRPQEANEHIDVIIHHVYNPENITQYNVVPGLFGIVITMTLVLMSGLAIVREKENGTIETLFITSVNMLEIITGKITPYIFVSVIQSLIVMLISIFIFKVPMQGDYLSLIITIALFIISSITVGVLLSIFSSNQLQSMQLTFFYFLPSVLISGFMFPFDGMPGWAKSIGYLLPTTYFLRLMRGIMLKGSTISMMWQSLFPLVLITLIFILLIIVVQKKTTSSQP